VNEVTMAVKSLRSMRSYYVTLLNVIGYRVLAETDKSIQFGSRALDSTDRSCQFELHSETRVTDRKHVRFQVRSMDFLTEFYRVGIELGGLDRDSLGVHAVHDEYRVVILEDTEGNTLEAVYQIQ